MDKPILRGDIYYADLGDGIGSEQNGLRPVLIIQNNIGNKHSPVIIVAAITSEVTAKTHLPTHYFLGAKNGLQYDSIVLLEQIRTLDKKRLAGYIGAVSKKDLIGIDFALAISIGFIDPITKKRILCLCNTCAEMFFATGVFSILKTKSASRVCDICNRHHGNMYHIIKNNK